MSNNPKATLSSNTPAFEFKSSVLTIPVLKLHSTDINVITLQLREKIKQAPEFFKSSPLLIDLQAEHEEEINLPLLIDAIRNAGIFPIGVRGGTPEQKKTATELLLPTMSIHGSSQTTSKTNIKESKLVTQPPSQEKNAPQETSYSGKDSPWEEDSPLEEVSLGEDIPWVEDGATDSAPEASEENSNSPTSDLEDAPSDEKTQPEENSPAVTESTLIDYPIRSGQRIYAKGDLTITAQVSAGAEIMAEGNIHIYSTLRGRALAGVRGNENALIFCSDLQAELVSIAGNYRISENIKKSERNTPVQIHLDKQALIIKNI